MRHSPLSHNPINFGRWKKWTLFLWSYHSCSISIQFLWQIGLFWVMLCCRLIFSLPWKLKTTSTSFVRFLNSEQELWLYQSGIGIWMWQYKCWSARWQKLWYGGICTQNLNRWEELKLRPKRKPHIHIIPPAKGCFTHCFLYFVLLVLDRIL